MRRCRQWASWGARCGRRGGWCHVVCGVAFNADPPRRCVLIVSHPRASYIVVGPGTAGSAFDRALPAGVGSIAGGTWPVTGARVRFYVAG